MKVAVLLATYNGEKYIHYFLDSLVEQNYKEFELIVRDDGSTDNTMKIINSYSNRLRITTLNADERLGAAKSFIRLLLEVKGNFDCYMFADQDDYWHLDKIHRAQEKLTQQDSSFPVMYFAGLELVDSSLSHISFPPGPRIISLNNALVENVATGCTIALNKKARNLVIENLPRQITMHDWWFYIIFSALGKIVYDNYAALKYRQHAGNAVGAATSTFHDLTRRTKRFFSKNSSGVFSISDQAEEFYRCFGSFLSAHEIKLVKELVNGKKTLFGRIGLTASSDFVRQKNIDTFILRIIFLLGRF